MQDYVRAICITEGSKIYTPDKESTMELDKKLKKLGIKTRPARNVEADIWSIYIISIPKELDRTSREL